MKLFAAASQPIGVLVADSNRMQAQLLTSALRRHSEFRVTTCALDSALILQSANSRPPGVVLLSLNASTNTAESITILHRFHRSHPLIPKVLLVESFDRELVVSAFRSGVRGIFSITDSNLRLLRKCISRVAAGQIWANTEQLNYIVDLVSQVPSLRVLNAFTRGRASSGAMPLLLCFSTSFSKWKRSSSSSSASTALRGDYFQMRPTQL